MSRYIDADALKNKVLEWMPPDPCGIAEREHPIETDIVVSLIMEVEDAPSIDIVRCKECKHKSNGYEFMWCDHEHGMDMVKPDDFCSHGVKKGADDE